PNDLFSPPTRKGNRIRHGTPAHSAAAAKLVALPEQEEGSYPPSTPAIHRPRPASVAPSHNTSAAMPTSCAGTPASLPPQSVRRSIIGSAAVVTIAAVIR